MQRLFTFTVLLVTSQQLSALGIGDLSSFTGGGGFNGLLGEDKICKAFAPKAKAKRGGCDRFFDSNVIFKILFASIKKQVIAEVNKCQEEVCKSQVGSFKQLLSGDQLSPGGLTSLFGKACRDQAKAERCKSLAKLWNGKSCKLCRVLALTMEADDIEKCVCGQLGGSNGGGSDLLSGGSDLLKGGGFPGLDAGGLGSLSSLGLGRKKRATQKSIKECVADQVAGGVIKDLCRQITQAKKSSRKRKNGNKSGTDLFSGLSGGGGGLGSFTDLIGGIG